MERKKIRIKFIEGPETIEKDSEIFLINYSVISNLLHQLKKIKKNQIEFIRYLNSENAWESINTNTPDINVKNFESINIMVKLYKKEKPDKNILDMVNKAKEISSSIDKEILELKQPQFNKNSQSSILSYTYSINSSKTITEYNSVIPDDEKPDIIVLTANPLVYKYDTIKELRVMNEFNNITKSIYKAVSERLESNLSIKVQFLTLTKNNFKYALDMKPKILHLICKSVYECDNYNQCSSKLINSNVKEKNNKEKNKDKNTKTFSPILLFENNNCEMEEVTFNILSKIFKEKKEKMKDITLFISTPLCKDVFNMFNSQLNIETDIESETASISETDFGFKNIIVQHTTLASAAYMEEFNRNLYLNLLDRQNLEEAFNKAKNNNISRYQFCCCYHEHYDKCPIKQNLVNELFRLDDEIKINNEGTKQININPEIGKIPHVYHLRYKCDCQAKLNKDKKNKKSKFQNNFCYHQIASCENIANIVFQNKKELNLCCCKMKDKNVKHNLDDIFQIYMNEKGKNIFKDYKIEEYSRCIILDKNNLPNYANMQYLVGFNKIFYNIFEFIQQKKENILNIHGCHDLYEIDNVINILIEFIKERKPYLNSENQKLNPNSKDSKNDFKIQKVDTIEKIESKNNNKYKQNLPKINSGLDLGLYTQKSAMQLHVNPNLLEPPLSFDILTQDDINSINNKKFNKNTIYIINALKFKWNFYEWINKLKTKIDVSKIYIIIFDSEKIKKIEDEENNYVFRNVALIPCDKYDNMVKKQIHKIEHEKRYFDNLFTENVHDLEEKELANIKDSIIENSTNTEMYYFILYLFNYVNSGLFAFEFNNLFTNENLKEAKTILDFYIKRKIINQETNKEQEKPKQEYTKYIKNKNILNRIINDLKIPANIRYNVLKSLFLFYAKKFRLLIKIIKIQRSPKDLQKKDVNVKGYKPNENLFSFSAIQNLGIWEPLNDDEHNKFVDNSDPTIYNIEGYFNHLNRNFKDIFKDNKIIAFCHKNEDVWKNIKEILEDISISMLTIHKMFNKKELECLIPEFKTFLEKEEYNFSKAAKLRLKLFVEMQNDYVGDGGGKENIENILNNIEKGFSDINNKEGQLETIYASCIRDKTNTYIWKDLMNKYKEKMKDILNSLKKEEKKETFVELFDSKINYKICKYKIKKKVFNHAEDFPTLKHITKIFSKNNLHFYVIKTLLLSSFYSSEKIKDNNNVKENKNELLLYFNAAYIYAMNVKNIADGKYIDYIASYANKKNYLFFKNLSRNESKYNIIKEELSEIYKQFGLAPRIVEENTSNLYVYKEQI